MDELYNPDVFHVEPPLWFIGKLDDPEDVARVVAAMSHPDGTEASAAMLFTDSDIAERSRLANFPEGWGLGRLDGRQDVLAYLHLAHCAGLAFVTFDPGRTMRLYKIGHVVGLLTQEDS